MSTLSVRTIAAAVGLALAMAATSCGESKQPLRTVELRVDQAGRYTLDGAGIEAGELLHALRMLRDSGSTIELRIVARSDTGFEALGKAVETAQEARIALIILVTEPPR